MTPTENLEQNVSNEFDLVSSESATVITPLHCGCMYIVVHYLIVHPYCISLTSHLGVCVELLMSPRILVPFEDVH